MKIAYLARRRIPSRHAHAVQIVKMCAGFAALGHEVDLFAYPGDVPGDDLFDRYGIERSFTAHHLPARWGFAAKWRFIAGMLRHSRVRGADLLFGRDILSLLLAARFGQPLVYEAHIIPPRGSARGRKLKRLFARPNFSLLVCVTSTLAELYRDRFPELAGKRILTLPNAAGAPASAPPLEPWPGRSGALQVGFVGRPFPGKGIEMMARAAARLPHADFHIVGAAAEDLGWFEEPLAPNLHFHGYQPHGRLGSFYARFDVAAAPYGAAVLNASGVESAAITSPLKLAEYMAAGLPTVVSDLPGVRDLVGADDPGSLLVPPGDLEAFVGALERLEDASMRGRLGEAARQRYQARHTTEQRARLILGAVAVSPED